MSYMKKENLSKEKSSFSTEPNNFFIAMNAKNLSADSMDQRVGKLIASKGKFI